MILRTQELLGHDDLILILMGEGLHLGNVHLALDVDGLGLLGKHHGHAELLCHETGDADAGGLNGQHLGDGLIGKPAVKFPADLLHQGNIHLVIQKAIHLQHIAGLYDSVFRDSLLQKVHCEHLPKA